MKVSTVSRYRSIYFQFPASTTCTKEHCTIVLLLFLAMDDNIILSSQFLWSRPSRAQKAVYRSCLGWWSISLSLERYSMIIIVWSVVRGCEWELLENHEWKYLCRTL